MVCAEKRIGFRENQGDYSLMVGLLPLLCREFGLRKVLKLIQQREEKAVERMSYLVELAQLRKVSLKELMK